MKIFGRWPQAGDTMHFEAFLREALSTAPGSDTGLSRDELFGLYTSWCLMSGRKPLPAKALWQGLGRQGITPGNNTLAMKGPAATDYIIRSAPTLNGEPRRRRAHLLARERVRSVR